MTDATPLFAAFAPPVRQPTGLRVAITAAYRRPEAEAMAPLLDEATLPDAVREAAARTATALVTALRNKHKGNGV